MTIGITINLEDGVLLIADGRQISPFLNGQPVLNSDANKIHQITPTIAAITFGIGHATKIALQILSDNIDPTSSPHEICQLMDFSVETSWKYLTQMFSPDVDITHEAMIAGLMIGGVARNTPFISQALHDDKGKKPSMVETEPYGCLFLGGIDQQASQIFNAKAKHMFDRPHAVARPRTTEEIINTFLNSAVETIRQVGMLNQGVGGTIRHVIIRRGMPYAAYVTAT